MPLAPPIELQAFARDLDALRAEIDASLCSSDGNTTSASSIRFAASDARPGVIVPVAVRDIAGTFETFSMWCLLLHVIYAALILTGRVDGAYRWLFPLVHFNAWAVLAGSHALIYFSPETLHAPRIRKYAHLQGRGFELLVGHEALHLLPLVFLYTFAPAFPAAGVLSLREVAAGTCAAVALGCVYLAWQLSRSNVYAVTPSQLRSMAVVAVTAGLLGNATYGFHALHS